MSLAVVSGVGAPLCAKGNLAGMDRADRVGWTSADCFDEGSRMRRRLKTISGKRQRRAGNSSALVRTEDRHRGKRPLTPLRMDSDMRDNGSRRPGAARLMPGDAHRHAWTWTPTCAGSGTDMLGEGHPHGRGETSHARKGMIPCVEKVSPFPDRGTDIPGKANHMLGRGTDRLGKRHPHAWTRHSRCRRRAADFDFTTIVTTEPNGRTRCPLLNGPLIRKTKIRTSKRKTS